MPSLPNFLNRHDRVSPVAPPHEPSSSCSSRDEPKRRHFLGRLLTRPSGSTTRASPAGRSGKPVHYADLKRLYEAWQKGNAKDAGLPAGEVRDLARDYIRWVEGQPESRKLRDRKCHAAGMLARAMAALPLSASIPERPVSTSPCTRTAARTPETGPTQPPSTPRTDQCVAPKVDPVERESHVRKLRTDNPDDHPAIGYSESMVYSGPDGAAIYRLRPVTSAKSRRDEALWGLQSALASTLHDAVRAQSGLDLCLPRATFALPLSHKHPHVVIVDAVHGQAPVGTDPGTDLGDRLALQRALLGQWLIGRPNPRWSDFVHGAGGRLLAKDITPHAGPLSAVWREAVNRGPSALFRTPDGLAESAMSCEPLDRAFRAALVRLDLKMIEAALDETLRKIKLHLPDPDEDLSRTVPRLLAPLRALQQAIRHSARHPDVPLEMLMADAGDCLHAIDKAEFR